jgi:methyltransferase-like protein/cyclopropane fatty-acyl-phospholipid synthase-like methyltransferase/Fe-S-cluster containining protein
MAEYGCAPETQPVDTVGPQTTEWQTVHLEFSIGDRRVKAEIPVPTGPTRLLQMLPIVQDLTDAAVGAAVDVVERRGHKISCRKSCGACCRQLTPISPVEAHHIQNLVNELPEPRRSQIKARFADARQRLKKAGLLEQLLRPETWPDEGGPQLGLKYFLQGIPCPFLEDESCSIYADRPIECRQYLVTSPAENCKYPIEHAVHQVPMSFNLWQALSRAGQPGAPGGKAPWVPLILAPEWAESHSDEMPPRAAQELLQQVFENLTGKDSSDSGPKHRFSSKPPKPTTSANKGDGSGTHARELPRKGTETTPQPSILGGQTQGVFTTGVKTTYDDVPYAGNPRYATHPNCLASVATLLGMKPTPIDSCRVLELGCGTGGNLIPMALTLPQSQFVGIDLSSRQIDGGRALAEAIGLTNIDLKTFSVMDVDGSFGQFDYIICHGVYSWVPPAVQDKILTVCKQNLTSNGIAYVSYNTYPGWHQRGLVREMLNYHVRQFDDPEMRTQQARSFLDFLDESAVDPGGPYARIIKEEAEMLRKKADWYVFHEHLEEYNEPLYFFQFAERAAAKGLQFLAEARNHSYHMHDLRPEVRDKLCQLSGDLLHLEQYVDFLRNRVFRQTLLCHDQVALNRAPNPEVLMALKMTSVVWPRVPNQDVTSNALEEFHNDSISVSTNNPVVKAALICLYEARPRSFSFDELWTAVQERVRPTPIADALRDEPGRSLLAKDLLQCYLANILGVLIHVPQFAFEASARPVASPLARQQALPRPIADKLVTTIFHHVAELTDLDLVLLPYLDGSRDRAALLVILMTAVADGSLKLQHNGQSAPPEAIPQVLKESLELSLQRLARFGLLVA